MVTADNTLRLLLIESCTVPAGDTSFHPLLLPPASTFLITYWVILRDKGVGLSSCHTWCSPVCHCINWEIQKEWVGGGGEFGIVSIWHFTINTNFKKLAVESCQAWMALLLDTELEIHNTHMGHAMASTQFTQIYMVLILEHSLCLPASIKLSDPSYIHWFISFMCFATESHSSQNHNSYASKYIFSACWNCHLGANPQN